MTSEKATSFARRISGELGIKITGDDPIIALMIFQEEENEKIHIKFQHQQLELLKILTEKLNKKRNKKKFPLIPTLLAINIVLTIIGLFL